MLASIFPRNSDITAKAGWYNKVDMTTLNAFVFKKTVAASFSEISGEEIQKLEEKAVNKNPVKTAKSWMNVLKSWTDIVKHEAKELDESSSQFFAEIRKSDDGSDCESDSLRVKLAAQTK